MVVGEGVASLASLQRSLTSQTKFYFGLPVPARQLAEEEKKKDKSIRGRSSLPSSELFTNSSHVRSMRQGSPGDEVEDF